MATRTGDIQVLLDNRIEILNNNAAEGSSVNQVFSLVSTILALVKVRLVALWSPTAFRFQHLIVGSQRTRGPATETMFACLTTVLTYVRQSGIQSKEGMPVAPMRLRWRGRQWMIWEGLLIRLHLVITHCVEQS